MDRAPVREVRQVLDLLEPVSRLDRVDQLLKRELSLAANHEVRVLESLLGQEAHVRSPEHGNRARLPHLVGKSV